MFQRRKKPEADLNLLKSQTLLVHDELIELMQTLINAISEQDVAEAVSFHTLIDEDEENDEVDIL